MADLAPRARVAYKLAGAVGFSRVTLQEHFPSDIFAGAFLGFLIAHYDVLQAHSP
ncbi:MAG: phosphatase PAP2 family protein [Acidobacteriota bacterium]